MSRGVNGVFAWPAAMLAVTIAVLTPTHVSSQAPTQAAAPAPNASRERVIVDTYCVTCHNARLKTANLDLSAVDLASIADNVNNIDHRELGEKIVRKLRAGMMPPPDVRRPDEATVRLPRGSLEAQLDRAAAEKPTYTPPGPHRLNRREYANAIHDLLASGSRSRQLPAGRRHQRRLRQHRRRPEHLAGAGRGLRVGRRQDQPAGARATNWRPARRRYIAPSDFSQTHHVDGLPFGTRGGLLVRHYFPVDGIYAFNWTPVRSNAGGLHGDADGEQLELSVDGERSTSGTSTCRGAAQRQPTPKYRVPRADSGRAAHRRARVPRPEPRPERRPERLLRSRLPPAGQCRRLHLRAARQRADHHRAVRRPSGRTTPRAATRFCLPAGDGGEEAACAQADSVRAGDARRSASPVGGERAGGACWPSTRRAAPDGDFEAGIERGLQMILADPEFVFRTEARRRRRVKRAGTRLRISDLELASRLSFFLWSTHPRRRAADASRARAAAQRRRCSRSRCKRMLADPRSQ